MNTDTHNEKQFDFWSYTLPQFINCFVLFLSFGLIVFISWDTYKGEDFLKNSFYMKYQFAVCIVFLIEYFYRFSISKHKIRFLFLALPFLLISIPYLNIITTYGVLVNHDMIYLHLFGDHYVNIDHKILYYIRFIPLTRALVALAMFVTYMTKDLATTVFASYVLFLVPVVYMSGLIFYIAEKDINSAVKNFWYAMWWAGMDVTTIGCYINPQTYIGMALGFILSLLGIIMFPIFTVYFGNIIQKYSQKLWQEDKKKV